MGNARIQLFVGREAFPSITCPIYNYLDLDTWLHVLLKCKQHHIYAFQTKRHTTTKWELRKFIVASKKSKCYVLMNASTFNNDPPEIPSPMAITLHMWPTKMSLQCKIKTKPSICELPNQALPPTGTS